MPTFELEMSLRRQGLSVVAGVDEVGRGSLAGPLVAAAVILPPALLTGNQGSLPSWLDLVDDSKKLTPLQRKTALEQIEAHAVSIGVGMTTPREIDSRGIVGATKWAMRRAISNLRLMPLCLLIDFQPLPEAGVPFHAVAHGDRLSYSIAAASIVAKVTRDGMMEEADNLHSGYEFSRHKGYATREHLRLLALHGPSPIHRRCFAPVRHAPAAPRGAHGGGCRDRGSRLGMPTARSRLGALGEGVAGEYLEAKGYEIVATNYRCQWGEVDIIARDGDCLAFVEVRTRRSQEFGAPEESLSSQ